MANRARKMVEMAMLSNNKNVPVAGPSGISKVDQCKQLEPIGKIEPNNSKLDNSEKQNVPDDQLFHEVVQNEVNHFEMDYDGDGYDSDCDPEYNPGNMSESTDSELEAMAIQLECNLTSVEAVPIEKTTNKRKVKKFNRNVGKAYINESGKEVPARHFTQLGPCRNKCQSRINQQQQQNLFNEYWKLADYNKRVAFVAGFIEIIGKKNSKLQKTSVRQRRFTCKYAVKIDGFDVSICKSCLIATLGEKTKFIRTITNKLFMDGAIIQTDKRGKHQNNRKCADEIVNEVKNHISQFPAYESHYTRRDSAKKYLNSDLNLSLMYTLYTECHSKPVSLSKYASVFKGMNLKFKAPKTDVCNTCETLKCKIEVAGNNEKEQLINEQKQHHDDADMSYKMKELDKSLTKSDASKMVCTFDLEQCLPTPYLKTSLSFYKRQLWTYNLTVHECISNKPHCFMWDETTAKRGGNDIASCLFSFLNSTPEQVSHIVFYSDSCPGQNKNSFVASMFALFMQTGSLETIDHKFLTVGHTHMECDVDHSVIERKRKKTTMKIHHPRDWYNFVRGIGTKNTFHVIEMKQDSFYNFNEFSKTKFNWRKVDTEGEPFTWNKVRWMRFEKKFGLIKFKNSLDLEEPFRVLKISRRGINSVNLTCLRKCYTSTLPINHEKKKDLLDLLPLLDTNFHDFYKNLLTNQEPNYDPDIQDSDKE